MSTTIRGGTMPFKGKTQSAWATHPGEILKYEFLKPLKISGYALAKAISVNPQRVSDITLKKSGISADIAMRLGKFFGTSAEFWMNLQDAYELSLARKHMARKLNKIKPYAKVA
jgi:addiction module HigA family antidote